MNNTVMQTQSRITCITNYKDIFIYAKGNLIYGLYDIYEAPYNVQFLKVFDSVVVCATGKNFFMVIFNKSVFVHKFDGMGCDIIFFSNFLVLLTLSGQILFFDIAKIDKNRLVQNQGTLDCKYSCLQNLSNLEKCIYEIISRHKHKIKAAFKEQKIQYPDAEMEKLIHKNHEKNCIEMNVHKENASKMKTSANHILTAMKRLSIDNKETKNLQKASFLEKSCEKLNSIEKIFNKLVNKAGHLIKEKGRNLSSNSVKIKEFLSLYSFCELNSMICSKVLREYKTKTLIAKNLFKHSFEQKNKPLFNLFKKMDFVSEIQSYHEFNQNLNRSSYNTQISKNMCFEKYEIMKILKFYAHDDFCICYIRRFIQCLSKTLVCHDIYSKNDISRYTDHQYIPLLSNEKHYKKYMLECSFSHKLFTTNSVCAKFHKDYVFLCGTWMGRLYHKFGYQQLHKGTIYDVSFNEEYILTTSTDRTNVICDINFNVLFRNYDYRYRIYKSGIINNVKIKKDLLACYSFYNPKSTLNINHRITTSSCADHRNFFLQENIEKNIENKNRYNNSYNVSDQEFEKNSKNIHQLTIKHKSGNIYNDHNQNTLAKSNKNIAKNYLVDPNHTKNQFQMKYGSEIFTYNINENGDYSFYFNNILLHKIQTKAPLSSVLIEYNGNVLYSSDSNLMCLNLDIPKKINDFHLCEGTSNKNVFYDSKNKSLCIINTLCDDKNDNLFFKEITNPCVNAFCCKREKEISDRKSLQIVFDRFIEYLKKKFRIKNYIEDVMFSEQKKNGPKSFLDRNICYFYEKIQKNIIKLQRYYDTPNKHRKIENIMKKPNYVYSKGKYTFIALNNSIDVYRCENKISKHVLDSFIKKITSNFVLTLSSAYVFMKDFSVRYKIDNITAVKLPFIGTRAGYLVFDVYKIHVCRDAISDIYFENFMVFCASRDGNIYKVCFKDKIRDFVLRMKQDYKKLRSTSSYFIQSFSGSKILCNDNLKTKIGFGECRKEDNIYFQNEIFDKNKICSGVCVQHDYDEKPTVSSNSSMETFDFDKQFLFYDRPSLFNNNKKAISSTNSSLTNKNENKPNLDHSKYAVDISVSNLQNTFECKSNLNNSQTTCKEIQTSHNEIESDYIVNKHPSNILQSTYSEYITNSVNLQPTNVINFYDHDLNYIHHNKTECHLSNSKKFKDFYEPPNSSIFQSNTENRIIHWYDLQTVNKCDYIISYKNICSEFIEGFFDPKNLVTYSFSDNSINIHKREGSDRIFLGCKPKNYWLSKCNMLYSYNNAIYMIDFKENQSKLLLSTHLHIPRFYGLKNKKLYKICTKTVLNLIFCYFMLRFRKKKRSNIILAYNKEHKFKMYNLVYVIKNVFLSRNYNAHLSKNNVFYLKIDKMFKFLGKRQLLENLRRYYQFSLRFLPFSTKKQLVLFYKYLFHGLTKSYSTKSVCLNILADSKTISLSKNPIKNSQKSSKDTFIQRLQILEYKPEHPLLFSIKNQKYELLHSCTQTHKLIISNRERVFYVDNNFKIIDSIYISNSTKCIKHNNQYIIGTADGTLYFAEIYNKFLFINSKIDNIGKIYTFSLVKNKYVFLFDSYCVLYIIDIQNRCIVQNLQTCLSVSCCVIVHSDLLLLADYNGFVHFLDVSATLKISQKGLRNWSQVKHLDEKLESEIGYLKSFRIHKGGINAVRFCERTNILFSVGEDHKIIFTKIHIDEKKSLISDILDINKMKIDTNIDKYLRNLPLKTYKDTKFQKRCFQDLSLYNFMKMLNFLKRHDFVTKTNSCDVYDLKILKKSYKNQMVMCQSYFYENKVGFYKNKELFNAIITEFYNKMIKFHKKRKESNEKGSEFHNKMIDISTNGEVFSSHEFNLLKIYLNRISNLSNFILKHLYHENSNIERFLEKIIDIIKNKRLIISNKLKTEISFKNNIIINSEGKSCFKISNAKINALDISEKYIVVASVDRSLIVYDIETFSKIYETVVSIYGVNSLFISGNYIHIFGDGYQKIIIER